MYGKTTQPFFLIDMSSVEDGKCNGSCYAVSESLRNQ